MKSVEVLLVEDNTGDAMLVRQALHDFRVPVHLHIARDGEQALFMLNKPPFRLDLIILDLNIPKVTGTALLKRWHVEETPVVVFSSSSNPVERERSLALGAREFVSKPTDLQEYSEAVCRMVDKWAIHDGSTINN